MEKRLKVCGKRNERGFNSDGSFMKLDSYDKMVLKGKEVQIALERWIFKAKYNLINKLVSLERPGSQARFNTIISKPKSKQGTPVNKRGRTYSLGFKGLASLTSTVNKTKSRFSKLLTANSKKE